MSSGSSGNNVTLPDPSRSIWFFTSRIFRLFADTNSESISLMVVGMTIGYVERWILSVVLSVSQEVEHNVRLDKNLSYLGGQWSIKKHQVVSSLNA